MSQVKFTESKMVGLAGEAYFAGSPGGGQSGYGVPPAGPPGGGQSGYGGPPSGGPGASWQQPNRPQSGPNKGVFIAIGGVVVAVLLLMGAVLFFVLSNDSEEVANQAVDPIAEAEPAEPAEPVEPAESDEPAESTVAPAGPQAVPDGEFPLELNETNLAPNSSRSDNTLDRAVGGYCGVPLISLGLLKAKALEFEAPDPVSFNEVAFLTQSVLEFDNPENARNYFDSVVRDNQCGSSEYNRGTNDSFTQTIEVQSPAVYGDGTMEVVVNAVGAQTGDQAFHAREFALLDGNYVYYTELLGLEEFPRSELTAALEQTASNLGLT